MSPVPFPYYKTEDSAMGTESVSTANYAAVIADLRAKRDELDRTINMLEAMAQVSSPAQQVNKPSRPLFVMRDTDEGPTGQFVPSMPTGGNTGIGEAVVKVLRENPERSLSTREVTDLLLKSGFPQATENPVNNVWSALSHRMKVKGDVVREGKNWRFARSEKGGASTFPQTAHLNGHGA